MKNEVKGQSVVKGAIILASAVFISRLIGLLYKVPINNILGDDGMAIYSNAYSVYTLLLTFSAVGMPAAISKLVSEKIAQNAYKEAHRVFKVALLYLSLIGIASTFILWFGAEEISMILKGDVTLTMPLRALAPTLIIVTVIAVIRGYFQGLGNMVPSAVSQVIEQLFNAIFSVTLAAVLIPHGIIASATGATLGPGIGALVSLLVLSGVYIFTYKKMHDHFSKKEAKIPQSSEVKTPDSTATILKKLILIVAPILLTSSIFSLMTTIDQKMLYSQLPASIVALEDEQRLDELPIEALKDFDYEKPMDDVEINKTVNSLVGQYMGKYYTMINLPISLILQITTAAMPAIAAAAILGHIEELKKKIHIVLKMGIMLAVPAAVGLSVFGMTFIPMLYSSAPDGGELLMYGSIVIIPMAIAQLTGGMLQGMGKQKMPVINAFIACVSKVVVNIIVLSIAGLHIYGIIISSMICYTLYAVLNIRALTTITKQKLQWNHLLIKPVMAASLMGIIAYGSFVMLNSWYTNSFIWIIVAMGIAVMVYGLAVLKLGVITENDLGTMPGGKIVGKLVFGKKG